MLYWAVWSPALWDTLVGHGLSSECPVLGAGGLRAPHTKFLADSTQQQYLFIYLLILLYSYYSKHCKKVVYNLCCFKIKQSIAKVDQ